jgi:hypothetical protein
VSRRSVLRVAVAAGLFSLALATGFIVSSQLGQRWLREEAELQLGLVLDADVHIDRIGLRLRYGLEVHGSDIRVEYPSPVGEAMSVKRASASFDTANLLIGRVRIARLELDGVQLDIRRDRQGVWSPPFVVREADEAARAEDDLERWLDPLHSVIESVHFLLRDQQVADHLVVRAAAITLVDGRPREGAAPASARLEGIDARLDRSWLRGEADFELTATWLGAGGRRAPVEMVGRWRDDDSDLHLAVAFTGIELASLRPYVVTPGRPGDIAGRVTGVLAIVTPQPNRGLIEVDWSFDDVESEAPIGSTTIKLSGPLETLQAKLRLEPRRLRLESFRMQGQSIETRISGGAARPLRPESIVSLRADLSRTELSDLRRFALGLPPAEADPFLVLLDRVESGHVKRVGVRGGARLDEWQDLMAGRRDSLPNTLRVFADVDDVTFGTSPTDTLSDASARLTFRGETLEMHGLQANYNGEPLPRVDFAVRGIDALLGERGPDDPLTRRAYPLPGLLTLWDIVRGDPNRERKHPPSPIRVQLDEFHHPALRSVLRDARIEIDPTESDLHIAITEGEWAGRPILGEAILTRGDEQELRIELVLASQSEEAAPEPVTPDETKVLEPEAVVAGLEPQTLPAATLPDSDERELPWATGRFASTGIHTGPIVFEAVAGAFAIRGQTLAVADVEARLAGGGKLEASGSFALDREGAVPVGVEVDASGAEADRVAQLFGLDPGFATGRAAVRGRLAGPLRPGKRLVDELVGRVEIEARDGEIQVKVPLLAAATHAIEGWSPTAASETLQYEEIETTVDFARGLLTIDPLALEGPLRVVASATIDLNQEPVPVNATFGFFLLRQADRLLGDIPLVNLLIPGSDRGLIGAYFEATGPIADPEVRPLAMKSIAEGMPLPEVLRQPLDALQELFAGSERRGQDSNGNGGTP